MPNFSLAGKRALVTGASRGIGQAMAIALAEAGADVICASSSEQGCNNTVEQIRALGTVNVAQVHADLSDMQAVEAMAEQALTLWGGIDILVNNGGTIYREPAVSFPLNAWQKVLTVNLDAAFLLSQKIGKAMIDQGGGKIINIGSIPPK